MYNIINNIPVKASDNRNVTAGVPIGALPNTADCGLIFYG